MDTGVRCLVPYTPLQIRPTDYRTRAPNTALIKTFYNQFTFFRPPLPPPQPPPFGGCVLPPGFRWPLLPAQRPMLNYGFSYSDLELVLYGHVTSKCGDITTKHALSGVRINEVGHGVDRVLQRAGPLIGRFPFTSGRISSSDAAHLNLPEELCVYPSNIDGMGHLGVFCRKDGVINGTTFGPFKGKVVNTSEIKSFDDNTYMWEIFKNGRLSHFIDGRGSSGNWMSLVNCARHRAEQNLFVIQRENEILYEVSRDLHIGEELLVWYGGDYEQFMGIPIRMQTDESSPEENTDKQDGDVGYQCERCGKMFAYEYYREKHLKYTKCVDQGNRKFPCHLCSRSFEKRDRLRIHILHVHEKHRPHKCGVCGKSFSQSSSLNKHMRVHSGERPYKCVYCNKAFTASSILRTHIRQHSGEKPFKCKFCGKSFASHAAHDSHVRRTHTRETMSDCNLCGIEIKSTDGMKKHMDEHMDADALMDVDVATVFDYNDNELHTSLDSDEQVYPRPILITATNLIL